MVKALIRSKSDYAIGWVAAQAAQATTIALLQADNAKLRECLERYCGDKCNSEYNPCEARKTLDALSTTSQEALGETK